MIKNHYISSIPQYNTPHNNWQASKCGDCLFNLIMTKMNVGEKKLGNVWKTQISQQQNV